ncbi:pyruvate kinase [Phycisphaerales bacterium ac7]
METPQAVVNIDSIIEVADGIMVARGDLGVEMDIATVPVTQKRLVRKAHEWGKPCIVATQMLESMINSASATRAEVSDVANAVLDGADAVMLSAETAIGRYPHLAVETMRRIAVVTEQSLREEKILPNPPKRAQELRQMIPALAHGAWHMANDIGAELIVVWSQRGGGARYLSRNNFRVPIVAFSSDPKAVRRMTMLYGVYPLLVKKVPEHRSDFAKMVDTIVLERGLVQRGQPLVLLGGKPLDVPGSLNTVAVRYAGDLMTG